MTRTATSRETAPGTYGYDLNNRLRTASKSGTTAALAYDAESRLRQSVITVGSAATSNLLYDGVELVAEYDAANSLQRRYVHGPGVDEPLVVYEGATTAATARSWLYADHLGSIVGTADSTGTSTAIYSYGPYGEPNTLAGQRFRYTGQQLIGPLGLYYYKARFYSPTLGRFLQTDPIGTADDLNLYAYVGDSPVNFTDPSGRNRQQGVLLAGGGAIALGDAFALARANAAARAIDTGSVQSNSQNNPRIYVTYTKEGPNGEIYGGRTSGFGTPEEIVAKRDSSHYWLNQVENYKPAVVDRAAYGDRGADAIRGREQQIIDFNGGPSSPQSGNAINGISAINPFYFQYMMTLYEFFGAYNGVKR